MTDAAKWKSVMMRKETYLLLRDIVDREDRSIADFLASLIIREWEWHFARETERPSQDSQIEKDPQRIEERVAASKNPFLPRKNPWLDR